MKSNIHFISAGAGSGKTWSLTETLESLLREGEVQPHGVIATTFTRLAAGELRERVRGKLIESGELSLANQMEQALIGTVNGVCGELLTRFAFDAGLPPELKVIDDEDNAVLLNSAMETVLAGEPGLIDRINRCARRLDIVDKGDRQKRLQWRKQIREIIVQARANNQSAETVAAQGESSAASLLQHFRQASTRDLDKLLLERVSQARSAIESNREALGDSTKTTSDYIDRLREVQAALSNDRMSWPAWYGLVDAKPGAKMREFAEPVQQLAVDVDVHPGLQQDIHWYSTQIFSIAARTMDAYQQLKTRKGLIDFVDQEQRVYTLLDQPQVRDTLRDEFQLLLVDEFQDTSPIQLALFLKLSQCVQRVIWVGDVKQSIYGFRGSDPALMNAVVERVVRDGAPPQVLPFSWRSTPGLVAWSNALFVPAFADSLAEEQVALQAKRSEDAPQAGGTSVQAKDVQAKDVQASVERWTLEGRNKKAQAAALANGVVAMLHSDRQVFDKQGKAWRAIRAGDIAVLCRTNNNLATLAEQLSERGLPLRYKRTGLLSTPEACLALACLRRMLDPSDTLASAEIHSLYTCSAPGEWLADRLAFLQNAENRSSRWLEDQPGHPVATLKEARGRLSLLTPVEALRSVIDLCDLRKTVYRWGQDEAEAQHRLNNLSVLLDHAADYEQRAATFNEAVTTLGLLLWMQRLAEDELDSQASGGDENAIQLVTHHGAKGLEWPVVVAADLDSEIKPRIWGLSVLPRQGEMDLDEVLEGRRLQYWCDFSNSKKPVTPLLEQIAGSERAAQARASELEEMKRLLYVSITRARDALVIPLRKNPRADSWMHCVDTELLLPDSGELALPCGTLLRVSERVWGADEETETVLSPFTPRWLAQPQCSDAAALLPLRLSPSAATIESAEAAQATVLEPMLESVVESVVLGEPLPCNGDYASDRMGSALHAVIAATLMGQPDSERILELHGMRDFIDPAVAQRSGQRFMQWIEQRFSPIAIAVEQPLRYRTAAGQQVQGWIDCLLETREGWVVIDHKSTQAGEAGWPAVAAQYAAQLDCYAEGVARASGKPVLSKWVHFALAGGIVALP